MAGLMNTKEALYKEVDKVRSKQRRVPEAAYWGRLAILGWSERRRLPPAESQRRLPEFGGDIATVQNHGEVQLIGIINIGVNLSHVRGYVVVPTKWPGADAAADAVGQAGS